MSDQEKKSEAQRQLELMQKMIDDAGKILAEIHKEVKARREKAEGDDDKAS